jgi:hypothetical protein
MAIDLVRGAARTLAATGAAVALVAVAPGSAHAATEYDGDATALRIEGLALQLFPHGTEGVPEELQPLIEAFEEIQSQGPAELQADTLTLAMPDQTIAHAEFPGRDIQGEIPDNPLVSAQLLEAASVRARGGMVSQAKVSGLSLGGGVLSAGDIRTSCRGDGDAIGLDVSQLDLSSNQKAVDGRVSLDAGTAVPIPGVGSITFNQQETDGSTYGEATNVVIDLRSDLSLAALGRLLDDTAPAVESAIRQVVQDLAQTRFGPQGEQPFRQLGEDADQLQGEQLWAGLDQAVDQAGGSLAENAPQLADALNHVARLDGTVTVANAACSQQPIARSVDRPQAPDAAAPVQPAADSSEPPLADTGSPAGMLGMAVAGLAALAGGTALRCRWRGTARSGRPAAR